MPIYWRRKALRHAGLFTFMLATLAVTSARTDPAASVPYSLELTETSAKVSTQATIRVTMRLRDGYRFVESYNNRIIKLSSLDKSVRFDREVVRGTIRDGSLVFAVTVEPTRLGRHPINGIIRFGYAEGAHTMMMVSVPLIATVTGTD
jgi:hypothetical protein